MESTLIKGSWNQEAIDTFLRDSVIPARLSCIGSDGFPRVVSLWFTYMHSRLLCVAHRSSDTIKILERNNKVGFEVAPNDPPYYGVRGQGVVELASLGDPEILETLITRYLGNARSSLAEWLLGRVDDEVLITIKPLRLFSWDYRHRM